MAALVDIFFAEPAHRLELSCLCAIKRYAVETSEACPNKQLAIIVVIEDVFLFRISINVVLAGLMHITERAKHMANSVGFVLIAHNKPEQTIRLIQVLNKTFSHPPIVLHHDFSQSDLNYKIFPSNVLVCFPFIKTGWAKFSVVEATMACLKKLYSGNDTPDWFYLLSNACYPIKPAATILDDLKNSSYDVHISHALISYNADAGGWQKMCYEKRYCAFTPKFAARLPKKIRSLFTLRHPLLAEIFTPFSRSFQCFAGEHWFTANRKAAGILLRFYEESPLLAEHYRQRELFNTIVPEESYYQTVFCNSDDLKLSQNHFRYIDWSTGGAHPKLLGVADFEKLANCNGHFARKFDTACDVSILNKIDSLLCEPR